MTPYRPESGPWDSSTGEILADWTPEFDADDLRPDSLGPAEDFVFESPSRVVSTTADPEDGDSYPIGPTILSTSSTRDRQIPTRVS